MIRSALAIGVALLLVSSIATGSVTAAAFGSADYAAASVADIQDVTNETADDIYRYENGSAILVYEDESAREDVSPAEFGADVSSGLLELLVVAETGTDQDVTGEFGLEITPEMVSGDGEFGLQSPEAIEDLDASVSGTLTPEQSTAEFSLDMTAGAGSRGPQVDSNGEIVIAPDSFGMDAEFAGQNIPGSVGTTAEKSQGIRMTEVGNGYEIAFSQERPVPEARRSAWNTTDAAQETVTRQYQTLANQFGGSAAVRIDSHEYSAVSNGSDRLDIEFTVTLSDIKTGVVEELIRQVSASGNVEFTAAERSALKQGFLDLTLEQLAVAQNQSESGRDGFVNAEFTNYQAPLLTYLDAFASEDGPINESDVETLRQQLDARGAADLEQTVAWDATVEAVDASTTRAQVDITYDTTNWDAYTDELADRGMPYETDIRFDGSAETTDGSIEMAMSFDVTQAQLVDSALGELSDTAEQQSEDESAVEAVRSLEDAEFQVAKADLVFHRDRVEVRAAAEFDDIAAFENAVDELPADMSIRQIYGEGDENTTSTYIYVEGLGMSENELRQTDLADDETTIHAPGQWDRSFPVLDVQSTADYLGVDVEVNNPPHTPGSGGGTETETPNSTDGIPTDTPTLTVADTPRQSSGFGPGPGAIAALLALLTGALLARRDHKH